MLGKRFVWALPMLLCAGLMLAACGDDELSPTPTPGLATTPTAVSTSVAGGTPTPVASSPTAVSTSAAGPGTSVSCPAGWTLQAVPARSYHFCTPPGWTVQQVSAAG